MRARTRTSLLLAALTLTACASTTAPRAIAPTIEAPPPELMRECPRGLPQLDETKAASALDLLRNRAASGAQYAECRDRARGLQQYLRGVLEAVGPAIER